MGGGRRRMGEGRRGCRCVAVYRPGAHRAALRMLSRSRERARELPGSHVRHRSLRGARGIGGRVSDETVHRGAAQCHRGRRLHGADLRSGEAMKPPSLTLGIEEEYQIIDPKTRELRSYITEILEGDHMVLGEIKPELHQSMVEIGTRVCRTPAEARAELVRLRGHVM